MCAKILNTENSKLYTFRRASRSEQRLVGRIYTKRRFITFSTFRREPYNRSYHRTGGLAVFVYIYYILVTIRLGVQNSEQSKIADNSPGRILQSAIDDIIPPTRNLHTRTHYIKPFSESKFKNENNYRARMPLSHLQRQKSRPTFLLGKKL